MKFDATKGGSLSKHFVSLKDGEAIVGIFAGEPCEFRTHWKEKRSEVCSGEPCRHCANGDKARFRFRVNLIVSGEDKKPTAKILEQGWKFYGLLSALNKEYPVDKNFIKIVRTGKTMNDTAYSLLPVAIKPSDETLRAMTDIKLLPTDPNDPFWAVEDDHSDADEEAVPF